jgi:hypothetical protein
LDGQACYFKSSRAALEIKLGILGWEPAFCGGAISQFDGRNWQVGPLEYNFFCKEIGGLAQARIS